MMIKHLWIDTDIGGDCDDAGALAIANIAARDGSVNLLGMTFTTSAPAGPACIDAINTYYGNAGIPIGMTSRRNFCCENVNWFQSYLAENFQNRYYQKENSVYLPAEDAISLIRRKLTGVPDGSVTFACIGQFNNVSDLMDSRPDEYSALSGVELVRRKVKKFVVMGGLFGDGVQFHGAYYELEYNVVTDIPSARNFVRKCPVPVVFCDFLAGYRVLTGGPLLQKKDPMNPVTAAYRIFQDSPRESWDPITVWYAIYGREPLFTQSPNGVVTVQSNGKTLFSPSDQGKHSYLRLAVSELVCANTIDEMLLRSETI